MRAASAAGAVPGLWTRVSGVVLLATVTFAAFAGVLSNGWILFDDPLYVYDNPHVNRGLNPADAAWYLHGQHVGNWHPLTSWSHQLDVTLFGLDPLGPHAVNLALHIANAILLWLVLFRFTKAWWRSGLVAALFALHPLRVESVAWISERKDVLSGLFFFATLAGYRRWVERPGRARGLIVLVTYTLGLMAKPMLVTLPFVLVLLDVWPLRRLEGPRSRTLRGLVTEKWPLFALAVVSAGVTFAVQRGAGTVSPIEAIPIARRVANALLTYVRYIHQSLWPVKLAVFYPYNRAIAPAAALLAAAGLALVSWWAFRERRTRPYLAVGWAWYVGMLVPVIGLIQVGGQSHADRYTYLPTIGLGLALAWGASELVAASPRRRALVVGAFGLVLGALAVTTAQQVARWKDTRTLFTHALAVTRDNPVAHQNLGDVLLREGHPDSALTHFDESLRLAPLSDELRNKRGVALAALGRFDEAIAEFELALKIRDTAELRHNLGFTHAQKGEVADAIREFEAALRLDSDHALSHEHLAAALLAVGRPADAEPHARRLVALHPADPAPRRVLAAALMAQGRVEEAIAEYTAILRLDPDDLDALVNIAWVRATHADAAHRDGPAAVRLAERARERSPAPVPIILSTLAAAYAEAGRFGEAVPVAEQAVAGARAAGAGAEAERYAAQLALYRQGRPFHFER